jgi:membrane associated rhomboid family serine protease
MLLLPYRDSSVARSLPVVTGLIVLACVVVMYGYQDKDPARLQTAVDFYRDSGLERIEVPRYQAYLAERTDPGVAERLHLLQAAPPKSDFPRQLLESDARFQSDLHAHKVVREDDPVYPSWSADRLRYDELAHATVEARYDLSRAQVSQPWRFVTYAFLHGSLSHLLGNMLVLVLVGPFVEAALGRLRFAFAYLVGAAAAGALHVLVSDAGVVGASGAIAATVGMLAVLYGTRKVPVFYWIFVFGTARIPALALLPVWLLNEGYQWSLQAKGPLSGAAVAYGAHVGGLVAGAILGWVLKPAAAPARPGRAGAASGAPGTINRRADTGSTLAMQAQDAAARLDIRRATRLYRELAELEPERTEYLGAYLNVTLLGADDEALQDAALRLLWAKFKTPTDELRKTFLQLTQPKVLKSLPIDEHLRLARRLVRFREDAAALRVIDGVLRDDHLRTLYGRQLADCLLGLFTAYARHGLNKQAEQINSRLSTYFPSADQIGGVAPTHRPPSTILTSLRPTLAQISLTQPDSRLRSPPPPRAEKLDG